MRASYSSPSYSLLARMGPAVESFQVSSETTLARLPSCVLDIQSQDGLGIAEVAGSGLDARRVIAAVAQHQADGVAAGGDLFGDVEGDVERALVVIGQAGRKHVVAHLGAVQIQLGEAQPGVVDHGAADRLGGLEFLAQQARGQAVGGGGGAVRRGRSISPASPRAATDPWSIGRARSTRWPGRPGPTPALSRTRRRRKRAVCRVDHLGRLVGCHLARIPQVARVGGEARSLEATRMR